MNTPEIDALRASTQTLIALTPELLLLLGATAMITAGAFVRLPRRAWAIASAGLLGAAVVALIAVRGVAPDAYAAVAVNDAFSGFVRLGFYLAGFVILAMAYDQPDDARAPEFFGSLLMIHAGAALVATANDLVLLFVGLEMVSMPTYLLLYLTRRDSTTIEAATKYFFLSIFASALLLFGLAYLYGVAGVSNLKALAYLSDRLANVPQPTFGLLAIVFVMAGLCFRVAAVPLHFYAPDVYQGSPTVIAALLSWVPKGVGFVAMIRALTSVFGAGDALSGKAVMLCWLLAVVTMTLGNTLALRQTDLKRLLAYSSIAHAGYLLIGIAAAFRNRPILDAERSSASDLPLGTEAVLLYLAAYALMTLGTFAVIQMLSSPDRPVESIDDLAGLGQTHPLAAFALALCMFSLAGVPPLAGFWGKFWVFQAALGAAQTDDAGLLTLLVILGGLNAAIGAYYYLRIVVTMYLRSDDRPLVPTIAWPTAAAVGACATLSLALGLYPRPLRVACQRAAVAAVTRPDPVALAGPAVAAEVGPASARSRPR